jgi:MFS family permease
MGRPLAAGSQLGLLGREPSFRRLFLATLGSGAGTWLALVALEVDIWVRTQSSIWVAALLIADLIPTFLIGILVGPLIDRLSRRRLMIGSDLVRFGVFAALPFTTSATQIVLLAAASSGRPPTPGSRISSRRSTSRTRTRSSRPSTTSPGRSARSWAVRS